MKRNFNEWIGKFRNSIANYSYYVDFDKIYKNVNSIKVELNILNSLIGSKRIDEDFDKLIDDYPQILRAIPILLAVRSTEIFAMDDDGEFIYNFDSPNYSTDLYKVFMKKTGLFDLIQNHIVNNLVDYVTGVETGLDSNGRKNRGGHLMENLVEEYMIRCGLKKGSDYFKELGTDLDKTRSSKRLSSMICYKGYFGVSVKDFIDSSMKVFVTSGL